MAKNSSATINWIVGGIAAYFVGSAIAGAIRRNKGIGKVERIKRRIYKEVSLAQDAGVDFSRKYDELTPDMKDALNMLGHDLGWKQSKRAIESGKPYTESYYGSLRRAWNAVSGCKGIGRAYNVKDANGNTVLTWIEAATEHIEQEPEQHVLLALPPHIEEKKKKKRTPKVSNEEYAEREEFAREFLEEYVNKHPRPKEYLFKPLLKQHYKGDWDINDVPENSYEGLIETFARKQLKVDNNNIWFIGVKVSTTGTVTGEAALAAEALLEAWNNRYIAQGFEREDLDDIRRALLDRAKLMQVVVNSYKEYEDKTHDVESYDPRYDRKIIKRVHDFGDIVSGDERYNHLDKINYVVWVSQRGGAERGGITYYPIRSYPDYDGAEYFVLNKYGKTGAKVIPVWDVPIEKITGLL